MAFEWLGILYSNGWIAKKSQCALKSIQCVRGCVEQADEDTTKVMWKWFSSCRSNAIPSGACHLVFLNASCSGMVNQHYSIIMIEVTVLEKRGTSMDGWERAYYPAQQIRE
jgi:hypothetical protein